MTVINIILMWTEGFKVNKVSPGVGTMLLISSKGEGSQQPEAELVHTWTLKHLDAHTQTDDRTQRRQGR